MHRYQLSSPSAPFGGPKTRVFDFCVIYAMLISAQILQFRSQISNFGKDSAAGALWAELTHLSMNAKTRQQRGKAYFELFVLFALGSCTLSLEAHEALTYIASSALLGYSSSFIVGKRLYQAHKLPVPEILKTVPTSKECNEQLTFLESVPSNEFYSNAIRIFWAQSTRTSLQHSFQEYNVKSLKDLDAMIQGNVSGLAGRALSACIDDNFLLHQAVLLHQSSAIEVLLSYKCDINVRAPGGRTALHLACCDANIPIIRLLLSSGADASINDVSNISPLHWLILLSSSDLFEVAGALVTHGADVNAMMFANAVVFYDPLGLELRATPLCWACMCRNQTAVSTLLSLGANPLLQVGQYKPLDIVLGTLSSEILELFFSQANILAMMSAAQKEHLFNTVGVGPSNELQRWCMHGSDYEDAYTITLDVLAHYGLFLSRYPKAISSADASYTPLGRAALSFNVPLAKALVKRGADINERDFRDGHSALDISLLASAAEIAGPKKMLQMVQFLLKNGSSLDPVSNEPKSRLARPPTLHHACRTHASAAMIRLLAVYGPRQINFKYFGETPLHIVARFGGDSESAKTFRALLDLGADPYIETDHKGSGLQCCLTATAYVISGGDEWQLIKDLLDHGSSTDIGLRGQHRYTVVHLLLWEAAISQGHHRPGEDRKMTSRLEFLLEHRTARERDLLNEVDHHHLSPTAYASMHGLTECVKVFLRLGAKTDSLIDGRTLLQAVDWFLGEPPSFVVKDHEFEIPSESIKGRTPRQTLSEYKKNLQQVKRLLGSK